MDDCSIKVTDCSIRVYRSNFANVIFQQRIYTFVQPIMLALCSILLSTYYAQNYAGIIGGSLVTVVWCQ